MVSAFLLDLWFGINLDWTAGDRRGRRTRTDDDDVCHEHESRIAILWISSLIARSDAERGNRNATHHSEPLRCTMHDAITFRRLHLCPTLQHCHRLHPISISYAINKNHRNIIHSHRNTIVQVGPNTNTNINITTETKLRNTETMVFAFAIAHP